VTVCDPTAGVASWQNCTETGLSPVLIFGLTVATNVPFVSVGIGTGCVPVSFHQAPTLTRTSPLAVVTVAVVATQALSATQSCFCVLSSVTGSAHLIATTVSYQSVETDENVVFCVPMRCTNLKPDAPPSLLMPSRSRKPGVSVAGIGVVAVLLMPVSSR
jgi:hypothetical protein